jgi:hypothetical protein
MVRVAHLLVETFIARFYPAFCGVLPMVFSAFCGVGVDSIGMGVGEGIPEWTRSLPMTRTLFAARKSASGPVPEG